MGRFIEEFRATNPIGGSGAGDTEKVDREIHRNGLQSLLVFREKEALYERAKEFGNPLRHSAILPYTHKSQPHCVVGNERHGNACPSACAVQQRGEKGVGGGTQKKKGTYEKQERKEYIHTLLICMRCLENAKEGEFLTFSP